MNSLICITAVGCFTSDLIASDRCVVQAVQKGLDTAENPSPLPPVVPKKKRFSKANKVTDLERLRSATKILNIHDTANKAALSSLPDGTYVYAFDSVGNLAIVNRMMDPGEAVMRTRDAAYLGSHFGLELLLEDKFGKSPQFVATGEVVMRNGRVLSVSNAAGTYPGGTVNLNYAVDQFHSLGLPIDAKTKIRDYSDTRYDPHGPAALQIRQALQLSYDPHQKALWEETRRVLRQVDQNLKNESDIVNFSFKHAKTPEDKDIAYQGAVIFDQWMQPEEDEGYIVSRFLKSLGEERYRKVLKNLSEALPSPIRLEKSLDDSAATYTWASRTSKQFTAKLPPGAPPTQDRSIVTLLEDEHRMDLGLTPSPATKSLSLAKFKKAYPHDINNLNKPQTKLWHQNKEFLLAGYDPKTGVVTLQRDIVKIVDIRINPKNSQQLITDNDLVLSRAALKKEQSAGLGEIKAGDLFLGSDGKMYEVRSYHSQRQGKLFLRRVEQAQVPLSIFERDAQELRELERARSIEKSNLETFMESEQGILDKPQSVYPLPTQPRIRAKLLGTDSMSRLSIQDIQLNVFGKSGMGKEITYQIQGTAGPFILKVRTSNPNLTEKGLKGIDSFVSQIPKAHADAVRSIDLLGDDYYRKFLDEYPEGADAFTDSSKITFFTPLPNLRSAKNILWHEVGHTIAYKLWDSNYVTGQEWTRAAVLDGHFISGYSLEGHLTEDFAETVLAYIATDGGRSQPGLRKAFKNRFDYLDRIFQSND